MSSIPHDPELGRLREEFGDQWHVWRVRGSGEFVATRLVDDDVEPTLGPLPSTELLGKLHNLGRRYGRHLSSEQLEAIERELAR